MNREKNPEGITSFNIMSIDPIRLLDGRRVVKDQCNNYKIEYKYDFRDLAFSKKQLISSIDRYESNALFYQMGKIIAKNDTWNEDMLLQSLVFIDFTDIFHPTGHKRFEDTQISPEKTFSRSELEKPSDDVLLCQLFNPENGFTIIFDDKTENGHAVQFVPFDKSGSMSRTCRISFIDKSIKDALDKRLLLDLDDGFKSIELISSKYYAYRGLYLTAAHRITANDCFKLNHETVIVINDDAHCVKLRQNQTADKGKPNMFGDPAIRKPDKNGVVWELQEYGKDVEEINPFDGEGLISPEYSKLINEQLGKYGHAGKLDKDSGAYKNEASSYQIRMPFTKGMLHAVDFNTFFDEYLTDDSELFVKDYYGIDRNIRKAQIILTESMFKCCKWLKKIWENEHGLCSQDNDPMKYFFEKMTEYDHALYVGNTNIVLGSSNRTKMNYQFLNTLDISGESFDAVVQGHVEQIKNIKTDMLNQWENENEADMSGEQLMDLSAPWLGALSKNDAFATNPKIRNMIEGTKETLVRDCGLGRLSVSGECRFFSCDLLALLIVISKRLFENNVSKDIRLDKIDNLHGLFADRFFMAKPQIALYSKNCYAFFRSPHLSRNEQCIMRPYIPSPGDVYEKYFSHLSGVVMVSRNSMAPMILSGADYDGDLVKVIADKNIVKAVIRGTYEKAENGQYERKLPIVNIPNTKELSPASRDKGSVPYDTIKNTFSNEIGLISNLAISAGKKEYIEGNTEFSNLCAACTVVTGLEIDAAKTGVHPTKNIKEIQGKLGKTENYYLDSKKAISALPRNRKVDIGKASKKTGDIKVSVSSENKARFSVHAYTPEDRGIPNIDRLPFYYAKVQESITVNKEKTSSEKSARKSPELFEFQLNDTAWKKQLDAAKLEKVKEAILAYRKILQFSSEINKYREKYRNTKYSNCAFNILRIQYDGLDCPLPRSTGNNNCSPKQALDRTYVFLDRRLKTGKDVQSALNRLLENEWHLASKEDRVKTLCDIIMCNDAEMIPPETISILSNFSNSGYRLLYYILKDLLSDDLKNMTPNKLSAYKESLLPDDEEADEIEDSDFFKHLYSIFCEMANKNASKKAWQKKIVNECQKRLSDIFDNDMDTALKYVYVCRKEDSSFTFFWDVLPGETIINNVCFSMTRGDCNVE